VPNTSNRQADSRTIPRYAGIQTFGRLPTHDQSETADIAVLGGPFDGAATFRPGARFGPSAIREASLLLRPYNEPLDLAPFSERVVVDAGDAPTPPEVGPAHAQIERTASSWYESGARVLGLGGDHSVALAFMRACKNACGRKLSVLQLDAHPDTWDSYFGLSVTHGTIFRRACEQGLIEASQSVQIGLRGSLYSATDYEESRGLGFHTVLARELDEVGISGVLAAASSYLRSPVYISFDIDVLDPAFAPGTGTPEPGGLTTREALAIIRGLARLGVDVVGCDLVEVSPPYDQADTTSLAAANVCYDLLSLMVLSLRNGVG
jgi:agmatinase